MKGAESSPVIDRVVVGIEVYLVVVVVLHGFEVGVAECVVSFDCVVVVVVSMPIS